MLRRKRVGRRDGWKKERRLERGREEKVGREREGDRQLGVSTYKS